MFILRKNIPGKVPRQNVHLKDFSPEKIPKQNFIFLNSGECSCQNVQLNLQGRFLGRMFI